MIKTMRKKVPQEVAVGWVCDACGTYEESQEEAQEWLSWRHRGGYNSMFGDGEELTLDLCQACLKTLLGHAIKTHGNAYFPKPRRRKALLPATIPLTPEGRNALNEVFAREAGPFGHAPEDQLRAGGSAGQAGVFDGW